MKNIKGFTLIELLMVISIIGLLSAIVLGSMQVSRDRGANAAIKQNISSLRSEVELLYSNSATASYANVCTDSKVMQIRGVINLASGATMVCYSNTSAWAASSPLKVSEGSFNYWCVDTSGTARGHATALGVNMTVCPTS